MTIFSNQQTLNALFRAFAALTLFSGFVTAAEATPISGVKTVLVDSGIPTAVGVALVVIAIVLLYLFRNVIVNTILGFLALALLSLVGIHVPINILTMLVIAVFGLFGLGVLVLLTIFRVI